jgi:hypothetical protein
MTSCDAYRDLLPLHAVDDTSVEESLRLEEHLQNCATCREELETYRRICDTARRELAAVPGAPEKMPGMAPSDGGTFGDLAGIRSARAGSPGTVGRRGGWLAAAAALLLAGVLVGRWSVTPVTVLPPPGATATPSVDSLQAPVETTRYRRPALSVFSRAARPFLTKAAQVSDDDGEVSEEGRSPPGPAGVDG